MGVAFEVQHDVDHVLHLFRTGNRAVLGHVTHEHTGDWRRHRGSRAATPYDASRRSPPPTSGTVTVCIDWMM